MNGCVIANLAVETPPPYSGVYGNIGCLLYFRAHDDRPEEAKVKVSVDTSLKPEDKIIGRFNARSGRVKEKLGGEAPYVEGDLLFDGEVVGYINSFQNEVGSTIYALTIVDEYEATGPHYLTIKEQEDGKET